MLGGVATDRASCCCCALTMDGLAQFRRNGPMRWAPVLRASWEMGAHCAASQIYWISVIW